MSATDELLRNNEEYAKGFDKADLPLPPAKGGFSCRSSSFSSWFPALASVPTRICRGPKPGPTGKTSISHRA